jgi:hypothetical protein
MPGKKRVGPFRMPEEPAARTGAGGSQKIKPADSRVVLARRAKKHLRDVAVGRVVVDDPDSEVRQAPRLPQEPPRGCALGSGPVEVDDDED